MRAAGTGAYSHNDLRGAWQTACRDLKCPIKRERFDGFLKAEAHCLLLEASPLRKRKEGTYVIGVFLEA